VHIFKHGTGDLDFQIRAENGIELSATLRVTPRMHAWNCIAAYIVAPVSRFSAPYNVFWNYFGNNLHAEMGISAIMGP
jgi:hypothetical protein